MIQTMHTCYLYAKAVLKSLKVIHRTMVTPMKHGIWGTLLLPTTLLQLSFMNRLRLHPVIMDAVHNHYDIAVVDKLKKLHMHLMIINQEHKHNDTAMLNNVQSVIFFLFFSTLCIFYNVPVCAFIAFSSVK